MRVLLAFLPLLGLVTAQMQRGNLAPRHPQDPFFNDLGIATSSRTQPPWARPPQHGAYPPQHGAYPPQHGAQGQFGGNAGQSGSSTKPPYQNLPVAPMGGAQVPNNNPDANANPNAQGGNSGGLAGFGEADIFHGVLDERQPLPGAAPGASGGLGQSSGEQGGGFNGGGGNGINNAFPIGAGGGGFNANDLKTKSDSGEVYGAASSVTTVVGVVVAVLIVIGIFALVAVFLVRQRRQSRVVIGSV